MSSATAEAPLSPPNDRLMSVERGQAPTRGRRSGGTRTVARLLAAVLATLFAIVLSTSVAAACSCADLDMAEKVDSADVVARVIVEESTVVDREDGGAHVLLTVRPLRVWKGDVISRFPLTTARDAAECGLGALPEGADLLLFATESEEQYTANSCGGTTDASESSLAELVEAAGPGEGIDPVVGDEPGAFIWPSITGAIALVLVAGLVVAWWVPRRHR